MKTRLLAALLTYQNGIRLDFIKAPGLTTADEDLVAGQLHAIIDFFHSFDGPSERRWLSLLTTSELNLVIERGSRCYLVVVVKGPVPPALRQVMQSGLREFEALNAAVLPRWSGLMSEIQGSVEILRRIMAWGPRPRAP